MKNLLLLLSLIPFLAIAQSNETNGNWHHLDPTTDNTLGISTNRAYAYLADRTPDTVIVAIIDNGAMTNHEDLQANIWVNLDEIPDNGIDDDNNGYIDDIHGWNFLGNKEGENLKLETVEITRIYARLHQQFDGISANEVNEDAKEKYAYYLKIKADWENKVKEKKDEITLYKGIQKSFLKSEKILQKKLKKKEFTKDDVAGMKRAKGDVLWAKNFMLKIYSYNLDAEKIEKHLANIVKELDTRLNPEFENRQKIVQDDPDDISDTDYGNNQVNVRGPSHGTSVASVVGAIHNELGYSGVARHVKLMILRIVPYGDERDKDVALAIRYAVKNGASIINCSFAKHYSSHPEFVALALEEAQEAGVLIVNGAGNSAEDNDIIPYYPLGIDSEGNTLNNFISVGASAGIDNDELLAYFTNYGKTSVDVLAPGIELGSASLHNKYGTSSGTSIAAPVVAGMAAVLKSYYPYLTSKELKEIIIKSVYYPETELVKLPGKKDTSIKLENACVSGGIVNLYQAILLIEKSYPKE